VITLLQDPELAKKVPHILVVVLRLPWRADIFAFGPKFMPSWSHASWLGVVMFVLLAGSLYVSARKKLD
jgi:hypothetical protein